MSKGVDDIVGYGKPPRATRFAKGKSGNPDGRPKGARNKPSDSRIDEIIMSEGSRLVDVKSDGKVSPMPTFQAIMRKVNVDAMKGDSRAQRLALDMISDAERRADDLKRITFERALQYKETCEAEMADAYAKGRGRPQFLVDPDNITLDPVTGDVTLSTLTEKQHKAIEGYHNSRWWALKECEEIVDELTNEDDLHALKGGIQELLYWIKKVRRIEKSIGGPFELLGDGTLDGLDMEVLRDLVRTNPA